MSKTNQKMVSLDQLAAAERERDEALEALRLVKSTGELAVVEVHTSSPGVKPPTREVWRFPRWALANIDAALAAGREEGS